MLIFGKVVDVYEGREYNGNVPDVAQVLDSTATGRKALLDITLDPKSVKEVKAFVDQEVLISFTEISGRGNNGAYTLRVEGRLADAKLLDRITSAGLVFVQ